MTKFVHLLHPSLAWILCYLSAHAKSFPSSRYDQRSGAGPPRLTCAPRFTVHTECLYIIINRLVRCHIISHLVLVQRILCDASLASVPILVRRISTRLGDAAHRELKNNSGVIADTLELQSTREYC
jgi:hypothetical protein